MIWKSQLQPFTWIVWTMESLPNTPVEDLKSRETVTNLFVLTHFQAAKHRLSVSFIPLKKAINILILKFINSEKATQFWEIFTLLLTTVHTVKSKVKILQNFVAFSEYMNFTETWFWLQIIVREGGGRQNYCKTTPCNAHFVPQMCKFSKTKVLVSLEKI